MPGFHRCSLGGLHTPAAKPVVVTQEEEEEEAEENLSSLPSLPEVVLQQHQCPPHSHHSLHFWLTILPIALIFTILLASIAAQEYSFEVSSSSSKTLNSKLHHHLFEQTVYISFAFGPTISSSISSSWGFISGNIGSILKCRWCSFTARSGTQVALVRPSDTFQEDTMAANQTPMQLDRIACPAVAQAADADIFQSSGSKKVEASMMMTEMVDQQPSGKDMTFCPQPIMMLSDSQTHGVFLQAQVKAEEEQELQVEGLFSREAGAHVTSRHEQSTKLKLPKFRKLTSVPDKTHCDDCSHKKVDCGSDLGNLCSDHFVHIAMTLDVNYLRGSMAAIYSILLHADCPSNIRFHFIATKGKEELENMVAEALPFLHFQTYSFNEESVKSLITHAVRHALEEPLNYARFYLAHMLDPCVKRIIYLDSDVLVLDRIEELWRTDMADSTVATPEYCHTNFTSYFSESFWTNFTLSSTFANKQPCYFNSGVMVINLEKWRENKCTARVEYWMEVQKEQQIYDLGSLPPLLLTFAGDIQPIDHRWNQHGLGGDPLKGDCRPSRNEPASLLHWSGGGKPWQRIDIHQPCPVDNIWAQYDLLEPGH